MKLKPLKRSRSARVAFFVARVGLFLCAALAGVTGSSNALLIQNGDFESPIIADGTFQTITPPSWSGGVDLLNPNAAGGLSGNVFTWPQAPSGQQYEDIGNTAQFVLSQAFAVAVPGAYIFTWQDNTALNIVPGFQTAPYSISLIDALSQPVFAFNFDSYHSNGAWQPRTLTQDLVSGTYTLKFTSLNSPNHTDTLIDDVAINSVPEPSSIFLFSVGLVGIFLLRNFSRASIMMPNLRHNRP